MDPRIEFYRGFGAFFEDPRWAYKLLVLSVLVFVAFFVPFFGAFLAQALLLGFRAQALRRAAQGDHALPAMGFDVELLVEQVKTGLKSLVAGFVWSVPGLLIGACLGLPVLVAITAVGIGATGGSPLGIAVSALGLVGVVALFALCLLPALVASMFVELTDDFEAAFRMQPIFSMLKNSFHELVLGSLLLWLAVAGLVMLGALFCGLGVIPAIIIGQFGSAHFLAQVYRRWVSGGGIPVELGPIRGEPSAPGQPQTF